MHQVRIEGILTIETVGGQGVAVVPGFLVDGIDADDLQLAAVDLGAQHVDHAAVFIFGDARPGGKHYNREAALAEREQFHVPTE